LGTFGEGAAREPIKFRDQKPLKTRRFACPGSEPDAYQPDVANTLSNLATFYNKIGQFSDAKETATEALGIYRELATREPDAYRGNTASVLSTLGLLYRETNQFADAQIVFSEALSVYRDLAKNDPHYGRLAEAVSSELSKLPPNSP
jgi:tetratricopeptide (TPR) repeat protein